ncbi:N-acetylmuramic acid 6-phosphate etherase [Ruania alba]|uniref:N-acetylmuramic acid 6-phosphate etherase n=1 Tax=Ruania alba TaxID=648782 RepID=A0A1H5KNG4_9MICO|nr:N-acetylmuramic acid 6-phosphate etherase [Ruania alba]SEE65508.1 N-acetylmuramic acid 6-phosphate etherase [Ruania alba]
MRPDSTEDRHPGTVDIDTWEPQATIEAILTEDLAGVRAAMSVSAELATLVEQAHAQIRAGGRIHYFGAGASGRLAFLDATESRPTFGVEGLFTAHFPGGSDALLDSSIDREDAEAAGAEDAGILTSDDVAIGVTASGSTAYVRGALAEARRRGAYTALIANRAGASLSNSVDLAIEAATGPEALTGSTRLKAGTATKVLLNAFSTALMMRAGRTWSNLMVQMVATNSKLDERAVRILAMATEAPEADCRTALATCDGELPVALTAMLSGVEVEPAREALAVSGTVRAAVRALT